MDVWLFVTGNTGLRRAFECLVDMASFTSRVGVLPFQREDLIVVKICQLRMTIMTTRTVGAILVCVGGGEVGIFVGMAVDTIQGFCPIIA